MLYWGMFTSGFIIGGIFATYILLRKESPPVSSDYKNTDITASNVSEDVNTIYDRLIKINYITGYNKNQVRHTINETAVNDRSSLGILAK